MVVEYLRYRTPSEQIEKFETDSTQAAEFLRRSPYCLGYELTQCEEEPECFILRIEWTSTEDHLKGFRGSEEFRQFLPWVRPYIGNLEEMRHYTPRPLEWERYP